MITASYRIEGGDFDGAGSATRTLKGELARIGVEAAVMRRIMIAAYEAEMNVVIHARRGSMWARMDDERLDLEVVDEGPGIPDIEQAMREGFSTASEEARRMGFGAGMGLPNIKKCSDLFEVETKTGSGTRVRSTIFLRGMAASGAWACAPEVLDGCRECLDCVKACPTRALRARGGRPLVLDHLCVGCTSCLTACTRGVFSLGKPASAGDMPGSGSTLVIPRGFAAGFPGGIEPETVLRAFSAIGFSGVRFFEEWQEALLREAASLSGKAGTRLPVIPPVCPAVVNLVESQFPSLLPHLPPLASPIEAAAHDMALVPVSMAVPCPAGHAEARESQLTGRLTLTGLRELAEAVRPHLTGAGRPGAGRHEPCESPAGRPGVMRVSGIRHVISVLEQMEAGALPVEVAELYACDQGCSGSPLLARDPFISGLHQAPAGGTAGVFPRRKPYAPRPGLRLDPDMKTAISKLRAIDALSRSLPGRDCGRCGAPSCPSFAEDVVLGRAELFACPFKEDA